MNQRDATPLVLIGAGKMGGALLAGWLENGLDPSGIYVVDPHLSLEMTGFLAERGIRHLAGARSAATAKVIVIAVKPQNMVDLLPELAPLTGDHTVAVSIAAGTTLATLREGLGADAAIVRAMPNTPAQIGRGMTVAVADDRVSPGQRDIVGSLLEAVGQVAWIEDEALMDAVTAVSGSGPAYVFLLAECLAEAGAAAGLPPDLAARLAQETIAGAGELLARAEADPATLRENVTSPGGTTAAALDVLMGEDALMRLLRDAVAAATQRSRELAG